MLRILLGVVEFLFLLAMLAVFTTMMVTASFDLGNRWSEMPALDIFSFSAGLVINAVFIAIVVKWMIEVLSPNPKRSCQ
jgi:undecaprenyl pyrophosphate phosphatase UppP